jgi:hypothetical protein
MGTINVASVLQYGKMGGRLKIVTTSNTVPTVENKRESDVKMHVQRSQGYASMTMTLNQRMSKDALA